MTTAMKKTKHKYRDLRTGCMCGRAVVVIVWFLCSGVVGVVAGTGGQVVGDPAPGRSPGPPARRRGASDSVPSVTLEESAPLESPWCEDFSDTVTFKPGSVSHVSLNLTHPIFSTEQGLVRGITYQGKTRKLFY